MCVALSTQSVDAVKETETKRQEKTKDKAAKAEKKPRARRPHVAIQMDDGGNSDDDFQTEGPPRRLHAEPEPLQMGEGPSDDSEGEEGGQGGEGGEAAAESGEKDKKPAKSKVKLQKPPRM